MQEVLTIKRRIKSFSTTMHTTSAMKLESGMKLRKTQNNSISGRPYCVALIQIMKTVMIAAESFTSPLLEKRDPKRIGVVLITSNRGLAGSYNSSLLNCAQEFVKNHKQSEIEFIAIGNKGIKFLKKQECKIARTFQIGDIPKPPESIPLVHYLVSRYLDKSLDQVVFISQQFISAGQQRLREFTLLPIPLDAPATETGAQQNNTDMICEPEPKELIALLLRKYINTLASQILLEAKASEHVFRMRAMSAATDNAQEMIAKLKLEYNQSRQAAITQEIIEIINGTQAQSKVGG